MGDPSAAELRDLVIDGGSDAALDELDRRDDVEARRAKAEIAIAAKDGSPGASRAVGICNARNLARLNQRWEAGQMPGIKRDVGHGPETDDEWRQRRRPESAAAVAPSRVRGRAPRAATNTRRAGSRRSQARSPGGGSPDDDGEAEPPGLRLWRHPRYGLATPNLLRLLLAEDAQSDSVGTRRQSAAGGTGDEVGR